jgi:glycopeptide antibiotics resistance protein
VLSHIHNEIPTESASYSLDPLAGWLTLAALVAIFFVALFPFNFSLQATAFRRQGFFLTWLTPVAKHWLGWFLNVLFFFPFGLGWAWWTRASGRRRLGGWLVTGLVGMVLSFTVEFLQLYVPRRDSSWDDVVMNTLGALVGWIVFRFLGAASLRFADSALDDLSASLGR